jgi:tetratricopeptide (TPR) repeat protein
MDGSFCRSLAPWVAAFALVCGCGPEARLDDIRIQQEAGQFAPTVEPLRKLLEATPDDPELNHLYGLALLGAGRPELAIWPLQKAAQHPDRAIEDGLLLARALLRGGSPKDAVEAANRVLGLAPERVDALRLLIEARLASRQHEEVLEDAERLLAVEPQDPQALIARLVALLNLERVDEAEQALAAAEEMIADRDEEPDWRPRLCAASATFAKEKGDLAGAEAQWNACLEQFPGEAAIVFGGVEFFGERAQPARGLEILRRALDANPTYLPFIQALAHGLGASGRSTEAEELLLAATRDGVNGSEAWFALADYYEQRNEPAKARDAMARGLMLKGTAPATQLAAYVDLLIVAGDYDKAEEIIPTLEQEPVIANLLRGRLLLARGEPGKALEALEEGLRFWPNHSVARWLAARAAEQLGDYDRALTEYLESLRNDPGNRDALLDLLRLLEAFGRHREAAPMLVRYQREKPRDAEMMVQAMRFASRAGQWDVVEQAAQRLGEIPGQRGVVVAEFAAIRARRAGSAAGVEVIRAAKLDLTRPINGPALRALVQYLIADGKPDAALDAADAALAAHPDQTLFHELRAQALRAMGDAAAAREALERALALEPERASVLAELAALAAEQGDRNAAIALYDRASRADPEESAYAWAAIQLLAASDHDGSELDRRLEALLSRHGTHAAAANLLAQRLRGRDPERAFALARRAVRCRGGPDALDTLGRLQLERGDSERAAKTLGVSLELRPDSPSTQYWLGRALFAAGDADGARRSFSAALAADDFPEKQDAVARLARLNAD